MKDKDKSKETEKKPEDGCCPPCWAKITQELPKKNGNGGTGY